MAPIYTSSRGCEYDLYATFAARVHVKSVFGTKQKPPVFITSVIGELFQRGGTFSPSLPLSRKRFERRGYPEAEQPPFPDMTSRRFYFNVYAPGFGQSGTRKGKFHERVARSSRTVDSFQFWKTGGYFVMFAVLNVNTHAELVSQVTKDK